MSSAEKPSSKGQAWLEDYSPLSFLVRTNPFSSRFVFLTTLFCRFCTTGLPSDIVVEVDDMTFHLHKVSLKIFLAYMPHGYISTSSSDNNPYSILWNLSLMPISVSSDVQKPKAPPPHNAARSSGSFLCPTAAATRNRRRRRNRWRAVQRDVHRLPRRLWGLRDGRQILLRRQDRPIPVQCGRAPVRRWVSRNDRRVLRRQPRFQDGKVPLAARAQEPQGLCENPKILWLLDAYGGNARNHAEVRWFCGFQSFIRGSCIVWMAGEWRHYCFQTGPLEWNWRCRKKKGRRRYRRFLVWRSGAFAFASVQEIDSCDENSGAESWDYWNLRDVLC